MQSNLQLKLEAIEKREGLKKVLLTNMKQLCYL